jgi:hypothetical protein
MKEVEKRKDEMEYDGDCRCLPQRNTESDREESVTDEARMIKEEIDPSKCHFLQNPDGLGCVSIVVGKDEAGKMMRMGILPRTRKNRDRSH